jgi:hypothetical protein
MKTTCKFCREERNLIKAHVIPESFFRRSPDGGNLLLMTNKKGEHRKRAPVGVYDKNLVCGKCERIWGNWDAYAAQELLQNFPLKWKLLLEKGKEVAYQVDGFDYKKLKLFFIAILWRASASQHAYYARIALGPFERHAKSMMSSGNPGSSEDFAVTLAKFADPLGTAMLNPHPEKWSGVNYCRFYLGGYVAYIKVDSRLGAAPLKDFALDPKGPLYVITRDFRGSKERSLMQRMAKNSERPHGH